MANPTSRKCNFTDGFAESAKLPQDGFILYYDLRESGLCLRAHSTGARIFVVRYRTLSGKERYWSIGNVKDWKTAAARLEANRVKAGAREGDDPLDEAKAN